MSFEEEFKAQLSEKKRRDREKSLEKRRIHSEQTQEHQAALSELKKLVDEALVFAKKEGKITWLHRRPDFFRSQSFRRLSIGEGGYSSWHWVDRTRLKSSGYYTKHGRPFLLSFDSRHAGEYPTKIYGEDGREYYMQVDIEFDLWWVKCFEQGYDSDRLIWAAKAPLGRLPETHFGDIGDRFPFSVDNESIGFLKSALIKEIMKY
ncbi:hypothetical protein [Nocardiopsis sp. LOL_012]|uniref:hypothetical protein n=1 Tax=Nocardiopsis sp. LOL_012 TaxID=3345409 RepID=UPI003A8B29D8